MPTRRKLTLHRLLGHAVVLAVAVHIGAILEQRWRGWGWGGVTELGWGSVARNSGVAAAWLLLVTVAIAAVRRSVPRRIWRVTHHVVPFAVLVLATTHSLLAGPDTAQMPVVVPGVVALTVLASVGATRVYAAGARRNARARRRSDPSAGATRAVPTQAVAAQAITTSPTPITRKQAS